MSDWKKVRLGNYIHEYSERNKDDADIPVYSVTNSKETLNKTTLYLAK